MSPWKALVFAAPITAILVLLALEQRQEVGVRLERAEIQSRIAEEKFDNEFREFTGGTAPTASTAQAERLGALERQRDDLDARLNENLQRLGQDSADLRQALDDLDQTPKPQHRSQKK